MRNLYTFLLLLVIVVAGCSRRQTVQISDVTKPAILTLGLAPGQSASVDGFSLSIRGKIDGTADIWGTELKTNYVSGKFEIRHRSEYYNTNFVINYVPVGVHTGQIVIKYECQSF